MMSGEISGQWELIDRTLRGLAEQRAKLDAEEAKWLREAERVHIWRQFGCASLLEYMERRLGYGPRAAQERLRVAFALDKLPVIAETLANAELPLTAVRELTRVATPETEQKWLEAAQDKNVHEIQQLVAGHKPGDLPTDTPDPELILRVLRFEVKPATYARMREAKAVLEQRHGCRLDDDAQINALCAAVLAAPRPVAAATRDDRVEVRAASNELDAAVQMNRDAIEAAEDATEAARAGRAKYQVAVTVCEQCRRGWQHGDGVAAPLEPAAVARAMCDAQHLGSLDGAQPARAHQDVAPSVRRFVWRRDRGTCVVPGCRSTRNLDIHHIVAREAGGSHEPENLTLLCEAHHTQLHDGLISITGKAPRGLDIKRRHDPAARPRHTKLDDITAVVSARSALVKRGYSKAEAAAAIDIARKHAGQSASVDVLVALAVERRATE
jgi:hypothetical protein